MTALWDLLCWLVGLFHSAKSKEILINGKLYKIIKQIGEGGFSFVYLAKLSGRQRIGDVEFANSTDGFYAVKKLRIQVQEQEQAFKHEVEMHRSIGKHPNVTELLGSDIQTSDDITSGGRFGYLLFHFFSQGTVKDLLDRSEATNQHVPVDQVLKLFKGICQGLMAFHDRPDPLAFRDLKPANILINEHGDAVLMDLGSVDKARIVVNDRQDALSLQDKCAQVCTAPFRAPELFSISSKSSFDERTDIWSLGCTLFALCYYRSPFDGTETAAMSGRVSFPPIEIYPKWMHDFIMIMLQVERTKRPLVPSLLIHLRDKSTPNHK